jgi:hypothetical protein
MAKGFTEFLRKKYPDVFDNEIKCLYCNIICKVVKKDREWVECPKCKRLYRK